MILYTFFVFIINKTNIKDHWAVLNEVAMGQSNQSSNGRQWLCSGLGLLGGILNAYDIIDIWEIKSTLNVILYKSHLKLASNLSKPNSVNFDAIRIQLTWHASHL